MTTEPMNLLPRQKRNKCIFVVIKNSLALRLPMLGSAVSALFCFFIKVYI